MGFKKGALMQGLVQGMKRQDMLTQQKAKLDKEQQRIDMQKRQQEFRELAVSSEYTLNLLKNQKLAGYHPEASKKFGENMKKMGVLPEGMDISKLDFSNPDLGKIAGDFHAVMKEYLDPKTVTNEADLMKGLQNVMSKVSPEQAASFMKMSESAMGAKSRQATRAGQSTRHTEQLDFDKLKEVNEEKYRNAKLAIERTKAGTAARKGAAGGMTRPKALKRISDIRKSIASFDKGDKMDALLVSLVPGYSGSGTITSKQEKAQMMEAFESEIKYLELFTDQTEKAQEKKTDPKYDAAVKELEAENKRRAAQGQPLLVINDKTVNTIMEQIGD